ncbi:MAG: hypothetical protein KJ729_10065 [Euryarchaeota archaeon]|nr:hypothetical protein [Euryarchaeota archaeon]
MFLFINRKDETDFLEERYNKPGFDFFVIYGRRRVGKTELIKNFIKNKPHIYMLCNKGGTAANVLRLKQEKAKFVNWNNKNRKEHYAVVAKSFSVRTGHARCIDIKELDNLLA